MNVFVKRYHRQLFYTAWFTITMLQAAYTELFDDEAYYWVYSLFPDWGYYDHPPLIAVFIRAGRFLFDGEAGVRFFTAILNTATIFLIEKLMTNKNSYLFYGIAACMAVVQIGGMITVPDLPLLFFVALFFVLYRRFMANINLPNALALGFSMAGMLYSKYHGVLVILFTLLSNLKILRYYQSYIAAGIALLLFVPHLYWQHIHDYPSVQYHLFERNAPAYQFGFTTEYILGQLALAGPLAGWLLLYAAGRHRAQSPHERALRFTMIGIYIFFLLSTFKGRVEANWTVPAFVGVIVLGHQYLISNGRLTRWVYRLAIPTLIIVAAIRVFMFLDLERATWLSKDEFHGNPEWVSEVSAQSEGLPVVFVDSYQRSSKYWFYSGTPSMSMNSGTYRRNNYNFWPLEDSLIRKPAYVVNYGGEYFGTPFHSLMVSGLGGRRIDDFYSFSRVLIEDIEARRTGDSIKVRAMIKSPEHYLNHYQAHPCDTSTIYISVGYESVNPSYVNTGVRLSEVLSSRQQVEFVVAHFEVKDRVVYRLCISSRLPGMPTMNSSSFNIEGQ